MNLFDTNNGSPDRAGIGFIIGSAFYFLSGFLLETYAIPHFIPSGTIILPYAQEFVLMIGVAGILGASCGSLMNLYYDGEFSKASIVGIAVGGLSLFFIILIAIRTTPQEFSRFNISNVILYGPLLIIANCNLFLGIISLIRSIRQ